MSLGSLSNPMFAGTGATFDFSASAQLTPAQASLNTSSYTSKPASSGTFGARIIAGVQKYIASVVPAATPAPFTPDLTASIQAASAGASGMASSYAASMNALHARKRRLMTECKLSEDEALRIAKLGVPATESRVASCHSGVSTQSSAVPAAVTPAAPGAASSWVPYGVAAGIAVVGVTALYLVMRRR